MAADGFLAEEGARVEAWLGGLLTRGLCFPDGLSVDQRSRERDAARAAAAELAGSLGEGAGIEARVQAAQFVAAHTAAMDWQAEANRRDLPPHARATAQRLARQLMALTTIIQKAENHAISMQSTNIRVTTAMAGRFCF